MKYIPLADLDTVSNALNFSTPDCHVVGGCDIYTTKAAGTDKKLYKNIEHSLESQYESLVRLSASLSPPYYDPSETSSITGKDKRQSITDGSEIDLSRASPFGPLSQNSARRTFAYLIATLNAAHPDYDFSNLLKPTDFRKERSLRAIVQRIDDTLHNLRPKHSAALKYVSPPSSAPSAFVPGNEVWHPQMWNVIDAQMKLRQCERYSYKPEEDPLDEEEGSLWSMHYFFFNKEKKRVCYFYLRGFSVVSHSPVHAPVSARRTKTDLQQRMVSLSAPSDDGAAKRAYYWLGDHVRAMAGEPGDNDDDNDDTFQVDDEVDIPFMNLDDVRGDLAAGRFNDYAIDDEDDDYDAGSWEAMPRHIRAVSEAVGEAMDLEE